MKCRSDAGRGDGCVLPMGHGGWHTNGNGLSWLPAVEQPWVPLDWVVRSCSQKSLWRAFLAMVFLSACSRSGELVGGSDLGKRETPPEARLRVVDHRSWSMADLYVFRDDERRTTCYMYRQFQGVAMSCLRDDVPPPVAGGGR